MRMIRRSSKELPRDVCGIFGTQQVIISIANEDSETKGGREFNGIGREKAEPLQSSLITTHQ